MTEVVENQYLKLTLEMSPAVSSSDSIAKEMSGKMAKKATMRTNTPAMIHLVTLPRLIFEIWPDLPETVVKLLLDLVNQLFMVRTKTERIIKMVAMT